MSKRKAVVRLLGPSVYDSKSIKNAKYPVMVEAELCSIITEHAEISGSVIDKIAPICGYGKRIYSLTWFNPWSFNDNTEKSWEEVEANPFEQWNLLKSSREVGAMPPASEVIR